MGWLNKLSGFFLDKEENDPNFERVHINELSDWLEQQKTKLISEQGLEEFLPNYVKKLKESRWFLECQLDGWEKNVTHKNLGYRRSEIKAIFLETRDFLEQITFQDTNNIKEIKRINSLIQPRLEVLIKKVKVSYISENYLFLLSEDEKNTNPDINPLLKGFINLNGLIESFKERVDKSGWPSMESINDKVEDLEKCHRELINQVTQLTEKEKKLKLTLSKKVEKNDQLEQLKKDPRYVDLKDVQGEINRVVKDLEKNEDSTYIFFSKFKGVLDVFVKQYPDNELAKKYLEKSTIVFYEDENLEIVSLLNQLKEAIIFQTIKLEADRASQLINLIENTKYEQLKQLQKKNAQLKQQLAELRLLSESEDINEKVGDMEYRATHFTEQVKKLEEEINDLKIVIDDNFNKREKINELLKSTVQISLNKEILVKF